MPKSKSEPIDLKKRLGARSQSSLLSSNVKKREPKPRSKSKSPRNSKVIPGVRISELKLIPNSNPCSTLNSPSERKGKYISMHKIAPFI